MAAHRVILWFRNDLRLIDNYIVAKAVSAIASKSTCEVVPLYCFDPRHFGVSKYAARKTGLYRARFLLQSVDNLKLRLREIGSDLLVLHGRPEDEIPKFLLRDGTNEVLTLSEVTAEELQADCNLEETLKTKDAKLTKVWGATLYHKDDLPMAVSSMQDVFTPWKDELEAKARIRACAQAPRVGELGSIPDVLKSSAENTIPSLEVLGFAPEEIDSLKYPDSRGVLAFKGGEAAGLQRVEDYIWRDDCLHEYFDTRNGMIGPNYSTKFSPWLALGCLSPRYIHEEAKRYEQERVKNKSTYWLTWELTCRDFYRYLSTYTLCNARFKCLKYGNKIFHRKGIANVEKEVDANMRELAATGFMSNRGRQNVASYLIHDLNVDWRLGAAWFEELLIDYDVCSNWANWNAAAGVAGGRINRFNAVKQSMDYDPEGDFCRLWIRELGGVPGPAVHRPWLLGESEQQACGVRVRAFEEGGGRREASECDGARSGARTGGAEADGAREEDGAGAGSAGGQEAWYPLPMVPPPAPPDPNAVRKKKKQ